MAKTATLGLIGMALTGLAACDQTPTGSTARTASNGSTDGAAMPANGPGRLRGTLATIDSNTMTVTTYDGASMPVLLNGQTKYAWVVKSSLATLKNGDFIGTATTGPDSDLKAVEIVIFPEDMRGAGEGHYGWDTPGVKQAAGQASGAASGMTNGTVTQSTMTNGTVEQSAMTNGTVQQSGMTNGTVTAAENGSATTKLTVGYKGGTAQVSVPEGTPVVRFVPTEKTSLARGQKLFIKLADDQKNAQFVAIGKDGLTPPM
ncbi:hypothetical protein [Sphingomonas sp. CV7422]|uniref:hypothetical protein n=1 Tax=Sphingomonas sp. CV7422 TaxID=3018036 RepID=UPI0022FED92A|nr:hypothetical protein [Sphingomonas sp. CV7422]